MRRIVLSKRKLGYMLLLFPLIEPRFFEEIGFLDRIFNIWKLATFICVPLLFLYKDRKIDKFIISVLYCYLMSLISTVLHGGWVYSSLVHIASLLSMILLVKMLLKEDPMLCFDVFLPLLEVLLYANLVTILLFPEGMYTSVTISTDAFFYQQTENWLLGLDNTQVPYYITGISIAVLRDYYRTGELKLSFRSWALVAVCMLTVIICWQVTAVVGMVIVLLALFLYKHLSRSKIFNIVTYMIVAAAFFFGVVVFRKQESFTFLISTVLQKSLTFSGRTYIWDFAIEAIRQRPLLGIGILSVEQSWNILQHSHAHNIILQTLFTGGMLSLLCFLYMHILVATKLMKNKHNGIVCFLSVVIFSMLMMNQVEVYQDCLWFAVYTLAFYSDAIITRQRAYQRENSQKYQIRCLAG